MDALDTTEAKARLAAWDQYGPPGAGEHECAFASTFGQRLNRKVNALGWLTCGALLLYDLQVGRDGFSGASLAGHKLACLPAVCYAALELQLPSMAERAMGAEFGEAVRAAQQELRAVRPRSTTPLELPPDSDPIK